MALTFAQAAYAAQKTARDAAAPGQKRAAVVAATVALLGTAYRVILLQAGVERARLTFSEAAASNSDATGPYWQTGRVSGMAFTGNFDTGGAAAAITARIEYGAGYAETIDGMTVGLAGVTTGNLAAAGKHAVLPRVPVAGRGYRWKVKFRAIVAGETSSGGGGTPQVPLAAPAISASPLNATTNRISGAPAGTAATAVRVYRKTASGGARTLIGTITPPATYIDDTGRTEGVALVYDATSTDGATESTHSAEKTATPQIVTATLIGTFQMRNSGNAAASDLIGKFAPRFARGHIPAGSMIEVRENDGATVVPSQQDAENTWLVGSDVGSTAGATLLVKRPGSLAAGATQTYQMWARVGAPDRTPNVTLAQVAQTSDIKARFHDADSADVYEVSVNDLIANNVPLWNAQTGWGANPVRGFQVLASGPLYTEYKLWGMFKRISDGGLHKYFKCRFWLRCHGDGKLEVMARASYSAVGGAVAGTTVGQTASSRMLPVTFSKVELLNGTTLIRSFGGPTDPRVKSFPASYVSPPDWSDPPAGTWEHVKGSMIIPASLPELFFDHGAPVRFTTTGELPGGIQADTTYYLHHRDTWRPEGWTYSVHATREGGIGGIHSTDITSTGSGTHTAIPMVTMHYRNGFFLCGTNGLPDQIGFSQPEVLCAQDPQYLTRDANAIQRYKLDLPPITRTAEQYGGSPGKPYWPNAKNRVLDGSGNNDTNNFSPGSDAPNDERIGWMSLNEVLALVYKPLEADFRKRNRYSSLWWADFGLIYDDEVSGTQLNCANVDYPGLGPKKPHFRFGAQGTSYGTGWGNPSNSPQPLFDGDRGLAPGYPSNYYPMEFEASHLPGNSCGAYLLTGDDWHLHNLVDLVVALDAAMDRHLGWVDPKFLSVFAGWWDSGGYRGWAWGLSRIYQAYICCPDTHPMRQYLKGRLDLAFEFYDFWFTHWADEADKRMGLPKDVGAGLCFQTGFLLQAFGMFRRRAEFPKVEDAFNKFVRRVALNPMDSDATDEHPTNPTHGCLALADIYFLKSRPQGNTGPAFSTWQEMMEFTFGKPAGSYVCPTNTWSWGHAIEAYRGDTSYPSIQLGGLAAQPAGDAQALKVYSRLTAFMNGVTWGDTPRYAIVPEGV